MRAVIGVLLAATLCSQCTGQVNRNFGKSMDAFNMEEVKTDCDREKFHDGILTCENGLKPFEKFVSEKKLDDACRLLKIYLSCVEDFQLFLSCENDPSSRKELEKVTNLITKNKLTCNELQNLIPHAVIITDKPAVQKLGFTRVNLVSKVGAIAGVDVPSAKKCSERRLMRKMVDCLKTMKNNLEPLLDNKKTNQKLICGHTEGFKSCVNSALSESDCNSDEEVLDQTTHFIVHAVSEHKWACKNIQTSEKKCEERSLVLKLNQCVRLLNKTVEPFLEDKENNKVNICRAGETFLLCVNEGVSESACRDDSEVMYHVSHFAEKILHMHKWSCEKRSATSINPKLENLKQRLELNISQNIIQHQQQQQGAAGFPSLANLSAVPTGAAAAPAVNSKCKFDLVRSSVDTCQQTAYDNIKKKSISQPKYLCSELKVFKDCSIDATKKHGCTSEKAAETYVYDRVKDSFYKYLTDCRPLWAAAGTVKASAWLLIGLIAGLRFFR